MREFTLEIYNTLLNELLRTGYKFITFEEYLMDPDTTRKTIILRHDVDKKPVSALKLAELENTMGIRGTYYFRVKRNEIPKEVIKKIAELNHEIGYHYEDLNVAKGNIEIAMDSFLKNLAKFRTVTKISTICMHGSPLFRYDNRTLWETHNYKELGIIGEPYLDVDFRKVLYLTDTGRRWDGDRFSIRDNISLKDSLSHYYSVKSTQDIIHTVNASKFPTKVMITIHPQRWTDMWIPWIRELVGQRIKNIVKYFVIRGSSH